MSANRIVKRRAFAGSQLKTHAYFAAVRAANRGSYSPRNTPSAAANPTKLVTYHEYAISYGDRHSDFQKSIRAEREATGLQPTSSDMHHVHGRRV